MSAITLPTLQLWPPLWAGLLPFAAGVALMPWGIGRLAAAGMGQRVRPEGPRDHLAKEGTPTAGGLVVVVLILLTVLLLDRSRAVLPAVLALGLGAAFGLIDDVLSVRGANRGLLARQRIGVQLLIGLVLGYVFLRSGYDTQLVPLLGSWHMGWLIVPVAGVALAGAANAFNLTDGGDGLAPGVMLVIALGLALVMRGLGEHLFVPQVRLALATVGALAAFLVYNLPPARVFIAGVGAEGIGMMLAALAISAGLLWYLPLLALVPVLETLSVVLQVYYFRRYRRRLLKMSPLHHHFQLSGWSEWRVALSAWALTAAGVAASVLLARPRR